MIGSRMINRRFSYIKEISNIMRYEISLVHANRLRTESNNKIYKWI